MFDIKVSTWRFPVMMGKAPRAIGGDVSAFALLMEELKRSLYCHQSDANIGKHVVNWDFWVTFALVSVGH